MGNRKRALLLALCACMLLGAAAQPDTGAQDDGFRQPLDSAIGSAGRAEVATVVAGNAVADIPPPIRCGAPGVTCTLDGSIVAVQLNGTWLNAPLSKYDHLADLPMLKLLNLSSTGLKGTLPQRWFAGNVSAFPELLHLSLHNNSLSGTLPADWVGGYGSELPRFPKLQQLDLGRNNFSGSLPHDLKTGGLLEFLGLDSCNFTGSLPQQWADTDPLGAELRVLLLEGNRLGGPLPPGWVRLVRQLSLMTLHGNQLTGPLPQTWGAEPSDLASQVVLRPGNPDLCGPVWTALGSSQPQAQTMDDDDNGTPGLDVLARLFSPTRDYTWAAGRNGNQWRNTSTGAAGYPALMVTNTLGSCAAPCNSYAPLATNVFDLSWQRGVGLPALLRVNDPVALAAALPGQAVALPCGNDSKLAQAYGGSLYLGGDLAYQQAAFSSEPYLGAARLLAVGSVVATPPGTQPVWGTLAVDVGRSNGQTPLARGGSSSSGPVPFWAVDLGASVEVSVLVVTHGGTHGNTTVTVLVGDDATSVAGNAACLNNVTLSGSSSSSAASGAGSSGGSLGLVRETLVLPPGRCWGRYVILRGQHLQLADVQVYPALADAAHNKRVLWQAGTQAGGFFVDRQNATCESLDTDGESGLRAAVDLGYAGKVSVVTVSTDQPMIGLMAGVANASTALSVAPISRPCELSLTALPPTWSPNGTATAQPRYTASCTLADLAPGQLVVLSAPKQEDWVAVCDVQVFLAQAPQAAAVPGGSPPPSRPSSGHGHSRVGIIVGATIGGLLGLAALATCLACTVSYRGYRGTQRRHAKLAKQLAAVHTAGPEGALASKDGMVAAAALEAMAVAAHKSELQLLKGFVRLKLRRAHDSVSSLGHSLVCCWAAPSGPDGDDDQLAPDGSTGSGGGSRSRLLPLFLLPGGRRRRRQQQQAEQQRQQQLGLGPGATTQDEGLAFGGGGGSSSMDTNASGAALIRAKRPGGGGGGGSLTQQMLSQGGASADRGGFGDADLEAQRGVMVGATVSTSVGAGPSGFTSAFPTGSAAELPLSTSAVAAGAPRAVQMTKVPSTVALGGLIDYSDIHFGKYLGDGSFGSVHVARWKHVQVAVKVLQRIDPKLLHAEGAGLGSRATRSGVLAEQTLRELAKEAGIMAALRHPCIVSYIGACLDPPCLVMEYCQRGSVYGVLSGASQDAAAAACLTWPRLLRFAWDASKGMLYLHTLRPPIVHRDLKSANLLVDANWHVKVSDFNLSRVMEPASVISTLSTANPRWMAPEVIRGEAPSLAADVFSFGVVLWELMTWDLPHGAALNPFQIANQVVAGNRLAVPLPDQLRPGALLVYDDYVALMADCWQGDPAARPTFDNIVQRLQEMTTRVVRASRGQLADG